MHDKIHLLFINLFPLTSGPFSMFIHCNLLREKDMKLFKNVFQIDNAFKRQGNIYLVIEQVCACKREINEPFKTQFFIKMSFTSKKNDGNIPCEYLIYIHLKGILDLLPSDQLLCLYFYFRKPKREAIILQNNTNQYLAICLNFITLCETKYIFILVAYLVLNLHNKDLLCYQLFVL